jgi:SAM-dependent methyltransferase
MKNSEAWRRKITRDDQKKFRSLFRLRDFPGFSAEDLRALEAYYDAQLRDHQAPALRVGWKSPGSQRVRFENLIKIGPIQKSKILDMGCGLGAFRGFLKDRKISADYTGVDLFPATIAEAKRLYPDARFEARVLTARPFAPGRFDYAFLSGVFNIKVRDNWKYMGAVLRNVLRQTKKAVAFNVLSGESGLKEPNRFTVLPGELVSFGKKLGVAKTRLLDDYHHLDLTLFLYK